MEAKRWIHKAILVNLLLILIAVSGSVAEVLWYDGFEDGKIDEQYVMKNHPGEWVEEEGVIKQTDPASGDHTYLIIEGGFAEPHAAMAKVRIDDWADHDLSRTGLGVRLDPGDGAGYAFLIHNTLNNMEFLNDHLAWKQNDTPPPFGQVVIGEWYWMKVEISDDGFKGKIWSEGEQEPDDWLLESALDFGAARPPSGNVGLNGGSNQGVGLTLVSFDDFLVCDSADECTPATIAQILPVDSRGKLATLWGLLRVARN